MKISRLIKQLQEIYQEEGNVEVFLASGTISCNHIYDQHKKFNIYDTWYTTSNGSDKKAILIATEEMD